MQSTADARCSAGLCGQAPRYSVIRSAHSLRPSGTREDRRSNLQREGFGAQHQGLDESAFVFVNININSIDRRYGCVVE